MRAIAPIYAIRVNRAARFGSMIAATRRHAANAPPGFRCAQPRLQQRYSNALRKRP
jgi:hypothetical protein